MSLGGWVGGPSSRNGGFDTAQAQCPGKKRPCRLPWPHRLAWRSCICSKKRTEKAGEADLLRTSGVVNIPNPPFTDLSPVPEGMIETCLYRSLLLHQPRFTLGSVFNFYSRTPRAGHFTSFGRVSYHNFNNVMCACMLISVHLFRQGEESQ